jgi:predicted DNA-binding transcriptional regulator YafY
LEKVQSAISAKQSLYILYAGGTRSSGQLRKIDPKQLTQGKDGQLVESYCHLAKDIRHFYLYKIKRIEDRDWVPPITPGMQATIGFFLILQLILF